MSTATFPASPTLPRGVMFNAYPDSIGARLGDTVALLGRPELAGAFSLFYILPTFFHSDLDRGFSVIDYDRNEQLVAAADLDELHRLGIGIKLDMVLNHLSVRSPQFQDLLRNGEDSEYRDFFIDWDKFWEGEGEPGPDGSMVPRQEHLDKLFMRKPGLPTLRVRFADGTIKTYWNTFYQRVDLEAPTAQDLEVIDGLDAVVAQRLAARIKGMAGDKGCLELSDLADAAQQEGVAHLAQAVVNVGFSKREYLGQMDLNARSEKVWEFYDQTLRKLRAYGARIVRLDAFAYLHKAPGQANFFNRSGTWDYLRRLRAIAEHYGLIVFPEIHAEYGAGIHTEIGAAGFPLYDFFFPGLIIDALDHGDSGPLRRWIAEIQASGLQTINMLGSHDGIPVLDLKGKQVDGAYRSGLLDNRRIDATVARVLDRGGLTKNLFDAHGKRIDYYQVNATFYSALGEDDRKMLLARAVQMFLPGVPQVWYLDLFVGTNDHAAVGDGGGSNHKEINRTNLGLADIEERLQWPVVQDQLALIRLRNSHPAFAGQLRIPDTAPGQLCLVWEHEQGSATLLADLQRHSFTVILDEGHGQILFMSRDGAGAAANGRERYEDTGNRSRSHTAAKR